MNDLNLRAASKAPEFASHQVGRVFSEAAAVVAASFVLGLAFLILS
jgi:hypothetical protein